jgi:hypothetical protein
MDILTVPLDSESVRELGSCSIIFILICSQSVYVYSAMARSLHTPISFQTSSSKIFFVDKIYQVSNARDQNASHLLLRYVERVCHNADSPKFKHEKKID